MKSFLFVLALMGGMQMSHAAKAKDAVQTIELKVTDKGFEPSEIKVKPGTHLVLKVTRVTDMTCATKIKVKEKKILADLPLNKEVKVDLGTLKKGDVTFACGMDMITGHVIAQ